MLFFFARQVVLVEQPVRRGRVGNAAPGQRVGQPVRRPAGVVAALPASVAP